METKDRIFNAAVKEINEKGFNNVSVEDITTAANVAKGTFYTHFESKEAVVFYTFTQSDEIYKRAYEKTVGEDFLSMITHFVRISYTEYEKRGKGIIKAIITNYFAVPGRNVYSKRRTLLKCLGKIVERGKESGALNAVIPTDWYVNILLSTLIGVEAMWCFDSQGRRLADMIEDAIRVTALGMVQPQRASAT
jgi:AcrR family transcriptional regulator